MTGFRRAASTCTPNAFMATSMPPLPKPSSRAPKTATGSVGASASATGATQMNGRNASNIFFAPSRSAKRPPSCIPTMPSTPPQKSRTAISVVERSSFTRSDGMRPM